MSSREVLNWQRAQNTYFFQIIFEMCTATLVNVLLQAFERRAIRSQKLEWCFVGGQSVFYIASISSESFNLKECTKAAL